MCGHGTCNDGKGTYSCSCKEGWELSTEANPNTCTVDIDECLTGGIKCNEGFECKNTDGSYTYAHAHAPTRADNTRT